MDGKLRTDTLEIQPVAHPQGCRTWLVVDPASREALVLDPHLDEAGGLLREVAERNLRLRWICDTHTHADHPSGAGTLASETRATRVAHPAGGHAGVELRAEDGETLALGDRALIVRHAPGHTPDHLVLCGEGALFSGDSLLIGAVARTDFLGGDAGTLYDSIHEVMLPLDDDTLLLPGHDYEGRVRSSLAEEKRTNPWLRIENRDAFARALAEGRPSEPANMAALLQLNRDGKPLPPFVEASEVVDLVARGGAASIIDVRTVEEIEDAHIPGSRTMLLDTIPSRLDEIRAVPAPRLLLCHVGQRAEMARQYLTRQGLGGVQTIVGGIDAYAAAGGPVVGGRPDAVRGGGGCSATPPPGP